MLHNMLPDRQQPDVFALEMLPGDEHTTALAHNESFCCVA